jgi:hypothetical protein
MKMLDVSPVDLRAGEGPMPLKASCPPDAGTMQDYSELQDHLGYHSPEVPSVSNEAN